jgi:hypothetical protein
MYWLIREQLKYKILGLKHDIDEHEETFYSGAKSYHCDKCGMDLCNAYFSAKHHDMLERTFCSFCIERSIQDGEFLIKNKNIFKGIFNNPKRRSKLNPSTALVLMYRYMTVEQLMRMSGLDPDMTQPSHEKNVYESIYQSLSNIENFPTESVSRQYCKITDNNATIHGKGLVAIRDIPEKTYIAELKGDMKKIVDKGSQFHIYLSKDTVIDSSRHDCLARYVNHSCKPNAAFVESWVGAHHRHVFLVSLNESICEGSEITVNYGSFRLWYFKDCLCPACKNNRGPGSTQEHVYDQEEADF